MPDYWHSCMGALRVLYWVQMTELKIRKLDQEVIDWVKSVARANDRSMEAELRAMLWSLYAKAQTR